MGWGGVCYDDIDLKGFQLIFSQGFHYTIIWLSKIYTKLNLLFFFTEHQQLNNRCLRKTA